MEIEKKTVHSRGIAVFTGLDPLGIQAATACSGRVGSASWIGAILSGTVLAVCSPSAWAAEPTPGAEVQAGATKAKESEPSPEPGPTHLMEGISQWRQRASARGFDFNVQYFGEVIGNLSGGVRRSAVYQGLLKAGFDLDGEKIVGWKGSILHISGLYAHGRSPSGRLAGDSLTLSNLDAYDSPYLFEAWLQQELFDGRLSLRVGQLAADEEFAGTAYGGVFTHSTFGWPPMISMNTPSPAYPTAAPGVRLEYKPTARTFFRVAVFDGNPDPGDANGDPVNKHGVRYNLSEGAFLMSEAGLLWNQGPESKGLPGTAKVGGWYHTEDFNDLRNDDTGLSLEDPLTSGTALTHQGNWGLYLTSEQMLFREEAGSSQGLGLFTRLGFSPPNRNVVQYYLELGAQYQGLIPGRDDDILAAAMSYARMSSSTRGLAADDNIFNATSSPLPDYEMALQVTYQIPVRAGWTVQPSAWYIRHPGGSSAIDDSFLVGLRTVLDF